MVPPPAGGAALPSMRATRPVLREAGLSAIPSARTLASGAGSARLVSPRYRVHGGRVPVMFLTVTVRLPTPDALPVKLSLGCRPG